MWLNLADAKVQHCQTAAEVRAHYRSVRSRVNQWKAPEPPALPPPRTIDIVVTDDPTRIPIRVHERQKPIHIQEPEPTIVHRHPSVYRIVEAVCEKFGVKRGEILSERRPAYIVQPRHIAMYLARTLTLKSLPEIGRNMGGRDHTTVLHGFRKIEAMRRVFVDIDKDLTELETILGGGDVSVG